MNIIQSNTYKTDLTAPILPMSQANLPVWGQQSYTFHFTAYPTYPSSN